MVRDQDSERSFDVSLHFMFGMRCKASRVPGSRMIDRRTSRRLDLRGCKFGRLLALRPSGVVDRQGVHWICLCECGRIVGKSVATLRSGNVRSCGCLHTDYLNSMSHRQTLARARGRFILDHYMHCEWGSGSERDAVRFHMSSRELEVEYIKPVLNFRADPPDFELWAFSTLGWRWNGLRPKRS